MSFPLYQSPGTIVFLDDDVDYLEMLALVLPRPWPVRLYLRPRDCLNQLQQEPPLWEADRWAQQQLIDRWRESGTPLIPQILRYWADSTERYAIARVCVVDFSMPSMDGLQALGELVDWPGMRVLLTGQADEQVAVKAFNRGLIDQFVAKQTPDISRHLIEVVSRLLETGHQRMSQTWRTTLTPRQNALLRVPSIGAALRELVAKRWVQYVVIGQPFGVLGMDADGHVGWLQLEPVEDLADLAALAQAAGIGSAGADDIRHGRKLTDVELHQSLGLTGAATLNPAFPVGREELLLAALFTVPPQFCPDPSKSFGHWLSQQPGRTVVD
ncbi:MAG: response regulator [Betaproteobacteria bacterium HGW-Betaproteobacteria-3]|jgi:CheY-like chemotaxis protein|nr:MAG: response regulator [Betaproteobacteria bacterium HGW-Betaproteobacteria-3]